MSINGFRVSVLKDEKDPEGEGWGENADNCN